ncbi:MAG: hypothetical protein H7123_07785 [Thermoleophilia bacterium]|nr:hypothetical protein [Thermoleophilia bacterium]
MKYQADAPTVVYSPHFDDAVLSCWTVLARPPASEVTSVYTGMPLEGNPPRNLELLDPQCRVRSNGVVYAPLQRLQAVRWHSLQAPLLRSWLQPHPAPASDEVIDTLAAALPAASVVYAPAAIGGHPDHVIVRDAAILLVRHGVPVRLYADLPYCLRKGWPSFIKGGRVEHDAAIARQWDRALQTVPGLYGRARDATVVRLTRDECGAKHATAARYLRQFGALNSGVARLLDDPESFAYELYWELPATLSPIGAEDPAVQHHPVTLR